MCEDKMTPECREMFDHIKQQLKHIDEALRGNGKPGVNVRLDRLEGKVGMISRLAWIGTGAVIVAVASRFL